MCLASDVFTVLFSPRFREGQELLEGAARGTPSRIDIHDDDPDAMTLLCRLLHHKYELDSEPLPDITQLEELAILTDKYNCAELLIIRHATNDWLMRLVRRNNLRASANLLALSYYFKSHAAFRFITKRLFRDWRSSFENLNNCLELKSLEVPNYVISEP